VGGRLATLQAAGREYEIGGSVIHPANREKQEACQNITFFVVIFSYTFTKFSMCSMILPSILHRMLMLVQFFTLVLLVSRCQKARKHIRASRRDDIKLR
jgi:hypothetical protein